MHKRHLEAQRANMLGFQFIATFVARRVLGKDENYMPAEKKPKRGSMSLDDTEAFFTALAGKGPDAA